MNESNIGCCLMIRVKVTTGLRNFSLLPAIQIIRSYNFLLGSGKLEVEIKYLCSCNYVDYMNLVSQLRIKLGS